MRAARVPVSVGDQVHQDDGSCLTDWTDTSSQDDVARLATVASIETPDFSVPSTTTGKSAKPRESLDPRAQVKLLMEFDCSPTPDFDSTE